MVKRNSNDIGNAAESSAKRLREAAPSSSDVDVVMSDPVAEEQEPRGDVLKAQAMRLLHTVKDAVNKEGRTISLAFLKRPSRKIYPDYYAIIQRPIALEDIKKNIEQGRYANLEAVRQDFELCFTNAKQYNLKESEIWRDAKDLLKLTNKTYNKMVPSEAGEDGEAKKAKPPSMTRMMKTRLQKLVAKTDDLGRVISTDFMELPSKKEWPLYYKTIKSPQCLENIFKRIKRKEYETMGDFAADVELVFANAMYFNQEGSNIYNDAKTLQEYFKELMSDLPPPFNLPQYGSQPKTINKIKIKMPVQPTPTEAASAALAPLAVPTKMTLPSTSKAKSSPAPPAALPVAQPKPVNAVPALTATYTTTFSHYPNATYNTNARVTTPISKPAQQTATVTPTPPPSHSGRRLEQVLIRTKPRGRPLRLRSNDGVRFWSVQLAEHETGVAIEAIVFFGEDDDDESAVEEEEEEEEDEDEGQNKNTRKKGKKGRTRQTRARVAKAKTTTKSAPKQGAKHGETRVVLNNVVVQEKADEKGQWAVDVPPGSNTLEVGEQDGMIWKVYIQRLQE